MLADAARSALVQAEKDYSGIYEEEWQRLAAAESWQKIGQADRDRILKGLHIEKVTKGTTGTEQEVLESLERLSFDAWRTRKAALPQLFTEARVQADKIVEPKTHHVKLGSATLRSPEEIKAWIEKTEQDLLDHLRQGPRRGVVGTEMKTLSTEFRRQLERTVIEARDVAEGGARVALETLAVHHHEPYAHMAPAKRRLRQQLRAHARQLGDRPDTRSGGYGIDHLVHECAYEHWHGMLFARFLAENDLLIEPAMEIAISMEECEELAREKSVDKWALAARFAHQMLPQVFRPDHPVFEVQFAREHRLKLEVLVEGLPADVFNAVDSLGWVYQFWQSRKKDEVNRSEVKIGSAELPAVTQLFTEPYMVGFLLHNSLGAWWVSRNPDTPCPIELTYLRSTEEGIPVAGDFDGWPDDLSEFRLLDPCCGSGHFLVAAFLMLVPMRMALEDLPVAEAVDAVLRDNLHGLELDRRCVELAAFALALAAWKYPGTEGYRSLPDLNIACSGLAPNATKEQWLALAELAAAAGGMPPERDLFGVDDSMLSAPLRNSLDALYNLFAQAPVLGSLIDPSRLKANLFQSGFESVQALLVATLEQERTNDEQTERTVAAQGMARAAELLAGRYHWVITNVPYLTRGKQGEKLSAFCEQRYPAAKNDLATVFLERCMELCAERGTASLVLPQNWLFLTTYRKLREKLLKAEDVAIARPTGGREPLKPSVERSSRRSCSP